MHRLIFNLTFAKYICLALTAIGLVIERIRKARKKRRARLADAKLWAESNVFWLDKIQQARDNGGFVTFDPQTIPPVPKTTYGLSKLPQIEEGKYMIVYGTDGCTLVMPGARYTPEKKGPNYYNWRWIT